MRTLDEIIIPTYNKFWTWDRYEGFKYDISKGLNLDFNAAARTRIDEPEGRINTPEKTDSVWKNIKEFGRTTNYTHSANANYTVPLNKFPLLDWTQLNARYGSTYSWLTGPLVLDSTTFRIVPSPLGNTISNNQNMSLNSDFNFRNFYNKVKFLKKYDTNAAPAKGKTTGKDKSGKEGEETQEDQAVEDKKSKSKTKSIGPEAFFIRLPLMLKRVNANYTENHGTIVPGYLPKPKFIGQDFNLNSPGWAFIFGYQPDSNWLNTAASKGWISPDTSLNYQFVQTTQKQFTMKWTIEPIKDVMIDLNFSKTKSNNISEYFKRPDAASGFQHLSRTEYGTFTVSYNAIKTSFTKIEPNQFSTTFIDFQNYRQTISQRLGLVNPNSAPTFSDSLPQYRGGYGPYSQDVLIPAFLAAFTGKDPNTINLGLPFDKLPIPNWRVQYNGLTKMAWAKKIWNNVNITHGYTSTLAVSSFTSALNFTGNGLFLPSNIDPTSNNFVSFYDIPTITISEQFAPLIGIDMTWKNSLTTKVEYKRSRNLSFSFLDYQLTEARTEELTLGIGYKFRNVPIPWKVKGKKKTLKNDLNFQLNGSYADNVTYSQKLDQLVASQPTSGVQTISVSPSVDYTVNNRLNVRVFLDKRITNPKISSSYPIRYTDGGVTLRFTLAQ